MKGIPPRLACLKQQLMLAASFAAGISAAQAGPVLPAGGTVAAGNASILQNSSGSVIQQQSQKAVINWQSFSVGAGGSVTFQQPGSGAIALNRVTGPSPSAIDGNLLANGQVWLVNGNGILFGQGSQINVGGLIATTSDIQDSDFMAGRYSFGKPSANPNAQVVNRGSIQAATGGAVVLSAGHVMNDGVITAKLGHVVLGGADSFSVDFDGDNLLGYQITAPVSQTPKDADGKPVSALVFNSGTIAAQGGQVLLTARAARNVVDQVINSTGIIQANTASLRNGEVVLDAGDGAVTAGGTVDVSGQNSGETGGAIAVKGEQIAIADGARLDASGAAGGGTVAIGAAAAQSVTVGQAQLRADATQQGQGGSIAIVSGGTARIAASLSAKGVSAGGHVETSGANLDISSIQVDTSASDGTAGLWLLDPVNVTVDVPTAATIVGNLASTNVSVTASNDINVNAAISYISANSLTFLAGHNLTVNASVQNGGAGAIFAAAGWDGVTAAAAILTTPGAYGRGGGSVLIGGAAGVSTGVALGSRAGTTTIAAQNLNLLATHGFAQLGYHGVHGAPVTTSGDILVQLSGSLTLTGSNGINSVFAQVGHGGPESAGTLSGNIMVSAQGGVTVTGGSAVHAYAQIGNGGVLTSATTGGTVLLTSAGDISMNSQAVISAAGAGDALVIATAANFVNLGSGVLQVSGGGRYLVFLNAPANNTPGSLSAQPFYNRAFNFSTDSYTPVTSAGDRFVYALAPVLTVTAVNQTKIYGSANPTLTATVTGALPGDTGAGVFAGAPALSTTATTHSGIGDYPIAVGLGSLISDFNYGFQFAGGTLHIDPAALTASLTGTVRKTYDGTVLASPSAANFLLTGILPGDSVGLSAPAGASYADKNVGTSKLVSVIGLTLTGADAGNYLLASSAISAAIGIIDPAVLTASLTGAVRKTYDTTTTALLNASNYSLAGVVTGDVVALNNPAIGSYADKNAGSGKIVTVNGVALTGADAGNYLLTSSTISGAVGIIDPAVLTASLTGSTRKTYDATTTASLTASNYGLTSAFAGDVVALNNPATGNYSDKNVGVGKTVTVGGLALTGADAGNYMLASSTISAAIGTIDPASITASLTGTVRKTYDATTTAFLNASNYGLTGAFAGDHVALNNPAIGSYASKTVGVGKTVTVSGVALTGADAGNYLPVSSTLSAAIGIIDPAVLTASLTGSTRKTYDATTTASLNASNYGLAGVFAGDHVALNNPSAGSYASKTAGIGKTVTVGGLALGGVDAGNYVLASSIISAAIGIIDPASITASLTGTVRKTYDATTTAFLGASNYSLAGVFAGDAVALNNPAIGSYASKTAGVGKTVTVSGVALTGADAGNYLLTSSTLSAAIGIIDPAVLTASLTGSTRKTYDATTTASLNASNYGLAGVFAGDSVALNNPATGHYADKNVGSGKTVTASGLALQGGDAGNYVLASSTISAAIGTIDPASVSASLTPTVQKIFDGSTDASLDASNYDLAGVIAGDDAGLNDPAAGLYDTRFVGTGKTVTVNGLALTGADAGNYVLTASNISGLVGVILVNRAPDVLGNSYTSGGSQPSGQAVTPGGAGGAQTSADATASTGNLDREDSAALTVGQSLSGSSHSSSSVVIDGLLRQFTPAPGSMLPHGIPPYGQVYSSWGNEAFWQ